MAEEHDSWLEGLGITWFKSNPNPAPDASDSAGAPGGTILDKAKEKFNAAKDLIEGKAGVPEESARRAAKSNAEVSLDEFNSDLGKAIGNVEKMEKAADRLGL